MKKVLIIIAPLCVLLFVLMWISWGLKGVFTFFAAVMLIIVVIVMLTKWIELVDKHIKD